MGGQFPKSLRQINLSHTINLGNRTVCSQELSPQAVSYGARMYLLGVLHPVFPALSYLRCTIIQRSQGWQPPIV